MQQHFLHSDILRWRTPGTILVCVQIMFPDSKIWECVIIHCIVSTNQKRVLYCGNQSESSITWWLRVWSRTVTQWAAVTMCLSPIRVPPHLNNFSSSPSSTQTMLTHVYIYQFFVINVYLLTSIALWSYLLISEVDQPRKLSNRSLITTNYPGERHVIQWEGSIDCVNQSEASITWCESWWTGHKSYCQQCI